MTAARFPIDSKRPGWNSDSHAGGIGGYRFRYFTKSDKLGRRSWNWRRDNERKSERERESKIKSGFKREAEGGGGGEQLGERTKERWISKEC